MNRAYLDALDTVRLPGGVSARGVGRRRLTRGPTARRVSGAGRPARHQADSFPPRVEREGTSTLWRRTTWQRYCRTLHPRRWFTGLWLNPDFREAVGLAHDRALRRADHVPRAAAHRGAGAERLALRGRRAHRARGPALPALRPLRGRPRRPHAQAAGDHRRATWGAGSRCSRSRSARGSACSAWRCSTWWASSSGLLTVIGWPAYQVFMTERVGRENLVEANAKIGVCRLGGAARRPRHRGRADPVAHGADRDPGRRVLVLPLGVDAARHPADGDRRAEGGARARCATRSARASP